MCERCGGHTPDGAVAGRRRKLWEIDPRLHCSIVGTCLTLRELRKIARKFRLTIPDDADEHHVHSRFVSAAGAPKLVAKSMQKTLERKFRIAIRRFGRAMTEREMRELWDRCMEQGEIPGPYWAIMTHPNASEDLIAHVFGETHMLSHLAGASNRADIRRLKALEQEKADAMEALDKAKRRLSEQDTEARDLLVRHAAEIRDLNTKLGRARVTEEKLEAAEDRLRRFESGVEYKTLWRMAENLNRRLAEQTGRVDRAEAQIAMQEREIHELRKSKERLGKSLRHTMVKCENLDGLGEGAERGQKHLNMDLGGRKIVYVGGRTGVIGHFKILVERANGTFLHHDGGIEDASGHLADILAQGDAVLCPVDCVSHGACLRAKRFCKRNSRTFVPLRSAGLSSFIRGLREIATPPRKHA